MPGAAHFLDVEKYYTVTQSVIDKISDIMYSTIITDNNILEIGMGDSSIQLKIVISNGTVSQFTKNYIPMEFRMSDHGRIKTIFITAYKYIFPLWIFRNIEIRFKYLDLGRSQISFTGQKLFIYRSDIKMKRLVRFYFQHYSILIRNDENCNFQEFLLLFKVKYA